MSRFLWLSLIFCVAISLIWWPGAKNEASIFELIERERSWQTEHLGFDLVDSIDCALQSIQNVLLTSPIPAGGDSTLAYSVGETDHELQAATHRISQQPYFQAMFALIVLALGRVLVTGLLGIPFLPLMLVVVLDALCVREVRHIKFRPSSSLKFRVSLALFFVLVELMFIMSLAPIWIDPFWILTGFILLSMSLHQMISHYYR